MIYINEFPFISGVISITACVLIYLWRHFHYWSRQGVPGSNFIEYRQFINIHHEWIVWASRTYGRVFGGYGLSHKFISVNEPDLIRDIFVKDFHIFPDHAHIHLGSKKISKSLFFIHAEEGWKRIRSVVSPAFTSLKLKAMMYNIDDISDKFVNNLQDFEKRGKVVDIRKYVGAFAMDVISACAYGIRVDSLNNPNHPIVANARPILGSDISLSQIICFAAPDIAKFFKLEFFDLKAVDYFDKLTNQVAKDRKEINSNTDNMKRKADFIQLMVESENNDDLDNSEESNINISEAKTMGTLSPDELTAQGILFFVAGYDTTSASISHTIYYLSQNKVCQQLLYEELQTLDEFTYENLNQLKYMNAIINETLRLAPPLTRVSRQCVKDYKLGNTGITIPAGASVEVLPYALHRDPEFWPQPEEFKPERFLNPTHHPYAYIPFGGGPRLCIGQRFALNEMRMCLAKLFNRYEFSLVPGFQLEYARGNLILSPKELLVNLKARK